MDELDEIEMEYDDYALEDYDDEEDMRLQPCKEYIKEGLPWPGQENFIEPCRWTVTGDLSGDIDWNNVDATVNFYIPWLTTDNQQLDQIHKQRQNSGPTYGWKRKLAAQIKPFTHNCGAKSIQSISLTSEHPQLWLEYLESFLYHCCNCSILVGSDCHDTSDHYKSQSSPTGYWGGTGHLITKYGTGYNFTPEIWNPNYKNTPNHRIFLFWKDLHAAALHNYWR